MANNPKRIEWFDNQNFFDVWLDFFKKQLPEPAYTISLHTKVTPDEIKRLQEQSVDLIITDLYAESEGLPQYATQGMGGYQLPEMVFVPLGGIILLESLCFTYNENTATPKMIVTDVTNPIWVCTRAGLLVPKNLYFLKPLESNSVLIKETIRSILDVII